MDLVISVFLFALQSDGENFRLAYSLLLELLSQLLLGFAEKRNIEWKIIQSILTVWILYYKESFIGRVINYFCICGLGEIVIDLAK